MSFKEIVNQSKMQVAAISIVKNYSHVFTISNFHFYLQVWNCPKRIVWRESLKDILKKFYKPMPKWYLEKIRWMVSEDELFEKIPVLEDELFEKIPVSED